MKNCWDFHHANNIVEMSIFALPVETHGLSRQQPQQIPTTENTQVH